VSPPGLEPLPFGAVFVTYVVYYEGIKRELKRRPRYECRCDERGVYTPRIHWVSRGGLEHLKVETRLIDERFVSVMGECVFLKEGLLSSFFLGID
jgi:hypothetical protein